MTTLVGSLVAAVALAAVHLAGRYLEVVHRVPRSAWLSAASGVSVAYVFVHLLPEIAAVQRHIGGEELMPGLERHAWLMALVGLTTFYGLEQWAEQAKRTTSSGTTTDRVGRLHIGSYAAYNALVGYLLHEQAERATSGLVLFAVAIGLHFVVNDDGLRQDHGDLYHDVGRYVLAGGVLLGWAVGAVARVPETLIGLPLAFVGGSVVMNVLKEELPSDRESRLVPFVVAGAAYTALLLLL